MLDLEKIREAEKLFTDEADFDTFYEFYDYMEIRRLIAITKITSGFEYISDYLMQARNINKLEAAIFGLTIDLNTLIGRFK